MHTNDAVNSVQLQNRTVKGN